MATTPKRKTYTNAQKSATILVAEQTSMSAASKATGIPITTIDYWMDRPEFVKLRIRAREGMAEEALVTARLGWALIAERLATFEPRDLINATVNATEKALLMSGDATSRTEHLAITDTAGLDDLRGLLAAGVAAGRAPGVELQRNGSSTNGKH